MKKNIKARRRGTSVLALGAALSIGAVITPVATAAPASAGSAAVTAQIENALNNTALVDQLDKAGQQGQSHSVETLEKFLAYVEANKDLLSDIVITLNESADTTDTADSDQSNAGEDVTSIVDLTMMTEDGKITTASLEDLPQEVLDQLREALEAIMGDAGDAGDAGGENTGENTDVNLSDSTSVSINITPDGGLSITVDTNKGESDIKTGEEAAKDISSIIDALNKLIEALDDEKSDEKDNTDDTDKPEPSDTDKPEPSDTDKPETDEESQRDRLVSAILALLGLDRGDDVSTDAERDALIAIAKALQDGKDVDLEKLTTEQLITVLDWLNNGIPEPSTSKDKDSEKSKEQQIRDLNKAVRDEINALDEQDAQKTASKISSLGSGPGSTVFTGSKSGSGSSGSSNSSTGSNTTDNTATTDNTGTADGTETPTEQPEVQPVSEELAVTGNSTQVMLTALAVLGLIGAGAVTVALRRTRDAG